MAGVFPATSPTMVEKLLDRSHPRWVQFDATYRPGILAVCRIHGLDNTDAEDLAQEVLIRVAQGIETYAERRGRFRTWLNVIIHSAFIDFRRSPKWRKLPQQDDAFFDRLLGDVSAHLGENVQLKAQTAIATMLGEASPRDAEVFTRRYFLNQKPEEVAREMPPLTVEAVNQIYSRCNAKLRDIAEAMNAEDASGAAS